MKIFLLAFFSILILHLSAQKNEKIIGIFRTSTNCINRNLSFFNGCNTEINIIRLNDFFAKPYITVKQKDKYEVSSYAFDLATNSFNNKPVLVLKETDIEKKLGKTISRFKPSAANINPVTGDVYIISSINKLLVITGKDMAVKEVYALDPEIFKQPEGLCFTTEGDLLISNEYAKEGKATILFFKYH